MTNGIPLMSLQELYSFRQKDNPEKTKGKIKKRQMEEIKETKGKNMRQREK